MTDTAALIEKLKTYWATEHGKRAFLHSEIMRMVFDPRLTDALSRLSAQLPESIKHCTIRFKECEKGHGRLTADNWVDHGCPWCEIARLTAPPPEEIAGLIARAESQDWANAPIINELAAALRSQAAENERLKKSWGADGQHINELEAEIERLHAAIENEAIVSRDAKAELDRLQAELRVAYKLPLTMGHPIAQKLAAERDAIRNKTFEECARLLRQHIEEQCSGKCCDNCNCNGAAKGLSAIRALSL